MKINGRTVSILAAIVLGCAFSAYADVLLSGSRPRTRIWVSRPKIAIPDCASGADGVKKPWIPSQSEKSFSDNIAEFLENALGKPELASSDEKFSDEGIDVEQTTVFGSTPLMYALAYPCFQEYVKPLLDRGADPNAKSTEGFTLLMLAAMEPTISERPYWQRFGPLSMDMIGELEKKIDRLLAIGMDPDEPDLIGKTARDYAAENPDPRIRALLNRLASQHVPKSLNRTPLMKAALESDNADLPARLLLDGESIGARDRHGWTALSFAAWGNPEPEIVRFLIEQGADVEARDRLGRTPLMLAAWRNPNLEVFRTLIGAGACLSLRDIAGDNAVDMAVTRDREPEILAFFLDVGSRHLDRKQQASDMLLAACMSSSRPETVRMLLNAGADPNIRDEFGQTPLMKAVASDRSAQILRTLIEAGADTGARDNGGLSVSDFVAPEDRHDLLLFFTDAIRNGKK